MDCGSRWTSRRKKVTHLSFFLKSPLTKVFKTRKAPLKNTAIASVSLRKALSTRWSPADAPRRRFDISPVVLPLSAAMVKRTGLQISLGARRLFNVPHPYCFSNRCRTSMQESCRRNGVKAKCGHAGHYPG